MRHLRYDINKAPSVHPQTVMKVLKIKYIQAVPQSMLDCWWFMGCTNVPAELPDYLEEFVVPDLSKLVGHGLSEEDVEMLNE